MNKDYNYQHVTREIAPEYKDREEFTVAILKDGAGHFIWARSSLGRMYENLRTERDISEKTGYTPEVLAIYPSINNAACEIINRSISELNMGKKIDLAGLLKNGGE